jgi:hypothetical protein
MAIDIAWRLITLEADVIWQLDTTVRPVIAKRTVAGVAGIVATPAVLIKVGLLC